MKRKKIKLIDKGFGTKKKKGLVLTGTLSWPDGSNYRGALKSEKEKIPHGEGVYFFPEDEQWYEEEGVKMHRLKSYFGEFKNLFKYEGEFRNGKKNGKGKTTTLKDHEGFKKGTVYEGNYKNDHMNGYCKITFPWGGTSKGIMNKGKFITKRKK